MHKDTPAKTSVSSSFKARFSVFQRPSTAQDPLSPRASADSPTKTPARPQTMTPARPRTMTMGLREPTPRLETPRDEPSPESPILVPVVPPIACEAVDAPDELPLTDIPATPDTAADGAPFSLSVLDAATGHVAMVLPPRWRNAALVTLVQGNGGPDQPPGKPPRMGIQRVWLKNGQLHVVGRRSREVLEQLTMALVLLRTLGVGSPGEPGFLEVLNAIPALLAVASKRPQQVAAPPQDSATLLIAEREWIVCVLNQLVTPWPALACRLFLHLTPGLQQGLLRRSPSTVDSLVSKVTQPADQQALGAVFETGLRNAMRTGAAAARLLPWIKHCPAWVAASLLQSWEGHNDPVAKEWWLRQCPALADALSDLGDLVAPVRRVMGDVDQPPERVLDLLREQGVPWQGSAQWDLATRLMRREVGQMVNGDVSDQHLLESYGRIVRAMNLLPKDNCADVLLQAVIQGLATQFAHRDGVLDERLSWLLDKLSLDFKRAFAQAVGHAFQRFCASPEPDVRCLYLQAHPQGPFSEVIFGDPVHLRWMLAPMIQRAGRERAFQARVLLHSNARARLRELFGADELAMATLAPEGLATAHWRLRYAYSTLLANQLRERETPAPSELKALLRVMASILHEAAHDTQCPLQPQEMAELASNITQADQSQATERWLKSLLAMRSNDTKYVACVASVILNAVAELYALRRDDGTATSPAATYADKLMEMLCRQKNVPIRFDVRFAGQAMLTCTDWTRETLKRWMDRLRLNEHARQRACVWMAELLTTLDPDNVSEERRQLLMYVRELGRAHGFQHLDSKERGILAVWRGLYVNVWGTSSEFPLVSQEELGPRFLDLGPSTLNLDIYDLDEEEAQDVRGENQVEDRRNDT